MNERYSEVLSLTVVIKPCDQGVVDLRQGQVTVMVLVHIGGHKAGYVGKAQSPRPSAGSSPERHHTGDRCRGEIGFREAVNQQWKNTYPRTTEIEEMAMIVLRAVVILLKCATFYLIVQNKISAHWVEYLHISYSFVY